MRLLLDTQIALWWLVGSPRLKNATRGRIAKAESAISMASALEVAIKYRIGKLAVGPQIFLDEMRAAGAIILPISELHVAAYTTLPEGHQDPFDLLLVAVARTEKLKLLTADANLKNYAALVPGLEVEAPGA